MNEILNQSTLLDESTFLFLADELYKKLLENNNTDIVELLKNACLDTNIKLEFKCAEDPKALYCILCQILLNGEVYSNLGKGYSIDEAKKNASKQLIHELMDKIKQKFPAPILEQSKFDLLQENLECFEITTNLEDQCRCYTMKSSNYVDMLKEINEKLKESKLEIKCFDISNNASSDKQFISQLYLVDKKTNEKILVNSHRGNSQNGSNNACVNDFFKQHPADKSINTQPTNSNSFELFAQEFKKNNNNEKNYWDIFENCARNLKLSFTRKFNSGYTEIYLDNCLICKSDYYPSNAEYEANIDACVKLIDKIDAYKETTTIQPKTPVSNRRKSHITKHLLYNDKISLAKEIRSEMVNNGADGSYWKLLVKLGLEKEQIKFDSHYETLNDGLISCKLSCNGRYVSDATGINEDCAIEEAAKCFVNKYEFCQNKQLSAKDKRNITTFMKKEVDLNSKTYWDALRNIAFRDHYQIEPKFEPIGQNSYHCKLTYYTQILIEADGSSRNDAREEAAKQFCLNNFDGN